MIMFVCPLQSVHGKEVVMINGKMSYDAVNERIRIFGESETAGKRGLLEAIILYQEVLISKNFVFGNTHAR